MRTFTARTLVVLALVAPFPSAAANDCKADGRVTVGIDVQPPAEGIELAGVVVTLAYPTKAVGLPGSGEEPSVRARVTGLPDGAITATRDSEEALHVSLASATAVVAAGRLCRVEFDRCAGVGTPKAGDFTCTVASAAEGRGEPVTGVTCTAKIER